MSTTLSSPMASESLREVLRHKTARARLQGTLIPEGDLFHATIEAKLMGRFSGRQWEHFQACGRDTIVRQCRSCKQCKTLSYHCDLKWCPRCQWKITRKRQQVLSLWAGKLSQPKHLVLTQKNFAMLSRKNIRSHQRNLARLRRSKAFRNVKGGCVSVEITNEGNGWHLHSHWLLDCRWLDMPSVCKAWAALVGQQFAIAKVKDVRQQDYVREVAKYVVEGSAIAGWDPEHVHQFVRAIQGLRFFFSFGSLWKVGPAIRAELKAAEIDGTECECGGCDFSFMPEQVAVLREITRDKRR